MRAVFIFRPGSAGVPVGTYVSSTLTLGYLNAAGQPFTDNVDNITVHVGSAPEPATLALLGLAGLGFSRRKQ